MTDRDRPCLGGRGLHLEPWQVRGQWIVQVQLAGVAEDEERGRGEELGDGADAVERVGGRGLPPLDVRPSEAARPDQRLVVHDPERHPR